MAKVRPNKASSDSTIMSDTGVQPTAHYQKEQKLSKVKPKLQIEKVDVNDDSFDDNTDYWNGSTNDWEVEEKQLLKAWTCGTWLSKKTPTLHCSAGYT